MEEERGADRIIIRVPFRKNKNNLNPNQFPHAWGECERGGYDPLAQIERSGSSLAVGEPPTRTTTPNGVVVLVGAGEGT